MMMKRYLLLAAVLAGLSAPAFAAQETIVVFFDEWSAAIDDPAREAIQRAAEIAKKSDAVVTVTGYADTTGSVAANKLLSATRAQVVADQLETEGVPAGHIKQVAAGEIPAPGDIKQESRRVGIVIGSP